MKAGIENEDDDDRGRGLTLQHPPAPSRTYQGKWLMEGEFC